MKRFSSAVFFISEVTESDCRYTCINELMNMLAHSQALFILLCSLSILLPSLAPYTSHPLSYSLSHSLPHSFSLSFFLPLCLFSVRPSLPFAASLSISLSSFVAFFLFLSILHSKYSWTLRDEDLALLRISSISFSLFCSCTYKIHF